MTWGNERVKFVVEKEIEMGTENSFTCIIKFSLYWIVRFACSHFSLLNNSQTNKQKTGQKNLPLLATAIFLCKILKECRYLLFHCLRWPSSHISSTHVLQHFITYRTSETSLFIKVPRNPNSKANSQSALHLTSQQLLIQLSSPSTLVHVPHLTSRSPTFSGLPPCPSVSISFISCPDLLTLECPRYPITSFLSVIIPLAMSTRLLTCNVINMCLVSHLYLYSTSLFNSM